MVGARFRFPGVVVANSSQMTEELACRYFPGFHRKGRTISLNRGIEVELALFGELHNGGGGESLRYRRQSENGAWLHEHVVLQIRDAVGARPKLRRPRRDGDGKAGNFSPGHLGLDDLVD